MEQSFTITVAHKGEDIELEGRLRVSAYTHQFLFTVGESEIVLERDDEGNFRALVDPALVNGRRKVSESLIRALVDEMQKNIHF